MTDNARGIVMRVSDLTVHYLTPRGAVAAVNGIHFDVRKSEILGLVGESGCGKTTAAMAILRVLQRPGKVMRGRAVLNGVDLLSLKKREHRRVRWRDISLVPQSAMNALNPVLRIRAQIAEAIVAHEGGQSRRALRARVAALLDSVGLPETTGDLFPHELSGGMKQRACIAMAIALEPSLIIADEPTSALDVVVQRLVAQTLLGIRDRMGVAMILIGHDMGLMAQMADRVAVMYAGEIAEIAPVERLFANPLHPYTQMLIESIPDIHRRKPLKVSESSQPDLVNRPPGCMFAERCPHAMERCRAEHPELRERGGGHQAACHLSDEGSGNDDATAP